VVDAGALAVGAGDDLAVHDQAESDAGADGEQRHRVEAGAHAEPVLGGRQRPHVVLGGDRDAEALADEVGERDLVPAQEQRLDDHLVSVGVGDVSGEADPRRGEVRVRGLEPVVDLADLRDDVHDVLGAQRLVVGGEDGRGEVGDDGEEVLAGELHAEEAPRVGADVEQFAGAAGGAAQLGGAFGDEAVIDQCAGDAGEARA
jgi:hypothetical protein